MNKEGEPKIRQKGRKGRYGRILKVVGAPIEKSTEPEAPVDVSSLLETIRGEKGHKTPTKEIWRR